MSLRETIISDLESIATDLENPVFTYNGEDYECVNSGNGSKSLLEMGGFSTEADLVLNVRKELFTDDIYPVSQNKLTFNSKTYRIDTVRHDATGAFLRLMCVDASRGV